MRAFHRSPVGVARHETKQELALIGVSALGSSFFSLRRTRCNSSKVIGKSHVSVHRYPGIDALTGDARTALADARRGFEAVGASALPAAEPVASYGDP